MPQLHPIRDYPFSLITGGKMFVVTPSADDFSLPAKALRVYVPLTLAEASVTYVAVSDGETATTVKFPPGLWYEQTAVKRVTAITGAGVEVHGVTED